MMTDVLFSLFSLSIGEKRNRLEFERNSPPTKKRERRTRLLYTNVYENFGKKKANLKRVPFSLSLLLSLSKAERKNESTTTTRTTLTLYIQVWGRAIFFLLFSPFFFCFFCKSRWNSEQKKLLRFCVCVCLSVVVVVVSALFFFF